MCCEDDVSQLEYMVNPGDIMAKFTAPVDCAIPSNKGGQRRGQRSYICKLKIRSTLLKNWLRSYL